MADENDPNDDNKEGQGHASVSQTVTNMAKTCMGTGCLALPFAAKQGGILLHVLGLLGVGIWNVITVERLCKCYDLVIEPSSASTRRKASMDSDEETQPLKQSSVTSTDDSILSYQSTSSVEVEEDEQRDQEPPKGTTTLVKLAWYALGQHGANFLDVFMVLYLIGVIVAYLNATRSFLGDTVFTTGIGFVDSFLVVAIMGPLSVVPHTGRLARASAMGLLVLLATFLVIAWYGYFVPADDNNSSRDTWNVLAGDASVTEAPSTLAPKPTEEGSIWLPEEGIAGVSQWFGIVVFGFGVTPLTFTFRNAMSQPQYLIEATWWAMLLVAGSYIVIGVGLWYPFPQIGGDVLHELPSAGWIPTMTRLAMVLVVLVTAPLLIVPCGEILEGKLIGLLPPHHYNEDDDNHHWKSPIEWRLKAGVRWSICLVCAAISTFVPGFVNVLSFVGCCCVAVVGFCVPPFLHFLLSLQKHQQSTNQELEPPLVASLVFDLTLFVWGLLATIVSTVYTFREIASEG